MVLQIKSLLVLVPIFIFIFSCYEFSSLQSAKILGKNEISIVPEYSSVYYTHTDKYAQASNNIGVQLAYGFSNSFNGIIRYSRIELDGYDVGYNFAGFEPKFNLVSGNLAFSLPLFLYYGQDVEFTESINIEPTLFITIPINKRIDVTLAPKYVVFLHSRQGIAALDINFAFSFMNEKVTLFPEIGYAFMPDLKDRFGYWSIGVAFKQHTKFRNK
jgi:hypothetical protein